MDTFAGIKKIKILETVFELLQFLTYIPKSTTIQTAGESDREHSGWKDQRKMGTFLRRTFPHLEQPQDTSQLYLFG